MSASSYLTALAAEAYMRDRERMNVARSLQTLQARVQQWFGSDLKDQFAFGSFTRQTNLPRSFDERSDVDFMIVFESADLVPATYLNWLREFSVQNYARSEVYQDHPTIVLELNHIKFDLVPARRGKWLDDPYLIPDGVNGWQGTHPNRFNLSLTTRNQECHSLLKPAIRLFKYWNVQSGYVYDSFLLERRVVGLNYWGISNLRDYLFRIFDDLDPFEHDTRWRQARVERAKSIVANVRVLERKLDTRKAEVEVSKLFD